MTSKKSFGVFLYVLAPPVLWAIYSIKGSQFLMPSVVGLLLVLCCGIITGSRCCVIIGTCFTGNVFVINMNYDVLVRLIVFIIDEKIFNCLNSIGCCTTSPMARGVIIDEVLVWRTSLIKVRSVYTGDVFYMAGLCGRAGGCSCCWHPFPGQELWVGGLYEFQTTWDGGIPGNFLWDWLGSHCGNWWCFWATWGVICELCEWGPCCWNLVSISGKLRDSELSLYSYCWLWMQTCHVTVFWKNGSVAIHMW